MPPDSPGPPAPEEVDVALVVQAQNGDLNAFDQIVARHQPMVTALLYRFSMNRADLEDLVQEAFVKAWRGLEGWHPDKPFTHWLKRIALRVGLEFCRRNQRSPFSKLAGPAASGQDALENLTTPDSSQESARHASEKAQWILAQLPAEDRVVLTLLYLDEMPLAEIADHFGWSRANAKVKAFRARRRLRSILPHYELTLE